MVRYSIRLSALLLTGLFLSSGTCNAASQAENNAIKLFNRLINLTDKTLSWKCFAQEIGNELSKDPKYAALAPVFSAISDSESPTWIGLKLKPYKDTLPVEVQRALAALTAWTLRNIIQTRIELNSKVKCGVPSKKGSAPHKEL